MKPYNIKITILSCLLFTLLCACEPVADGTGDGDPGTAAPSGAPPADVSAPPLVLKPGQRYNDVFCLAWAPEAAVHPALNVNRFNHDVYTLVYESLFTLDGSFEPVPALCRDFEANGGGTVFTFHLADGAAFHDGSPLTAADVVNSFAMARTASSPYAKRLSGVTDVRDSGGEAGEAVTVTLNAPNPRFPALLTFPVTRKESEGFPWDGTGPFRFAQDQDGVISLELYTAWWRRAAMPLGHIELCKLSGLDELPYLLGVGDVSAVSNDPNDSFGVGFKGDFAVWDYPTLILQYIGVNAGHHLLGDSRMRRALSAGIDRAALCAKVYQSDADPAALPIPPSNPLYRGGEPKPNSRLMTNLLTDMGMADENGGGFLQYPDGGVWRSFTLRFLVEEDDGTACDAVLMICGQLADAGIDARYTPLPRAEFDAALKNGDYELYYARETVPADFDLNGWAAREGARVRDGAVAALNGSWEADMPAIPLLFRRQALITRRSVADGVKPLFLRPFDNIPEWTIRK